MPHKDPIKKYLHYKKYREENKEVIRAKKLKYRLENKEKIADHNKEFRENNKDLIRERKRLYRENNVEKIKKHKKEYYENNKNEIIKKQKEYTKTEDYKIKRNIRHKRRYHSDIKYKLSNRLRCRFWEALQMQNVKKQNSITKLLGMTIGEFKEYFKKLFKPGMTWDNHGEWHIDHIRPCASFDLSDLQQQKECFHYTNLQPLWAIDNIRKHDKIIT